MALPNLKWSRQFMVRGKVKTCGLAMFVVNIDRKAAISCKTNFLLYVREQSAACLRRYVWYLINLLMTFFKTPFLEIFQLLQSISHKRQFTEIRGFADFPWSLFYKKLGANS